MSSDEGGVGTIRCSGRRFFCARGAFEAFLVAPAFFDLEDACFDGLFLAAALALRRRADARAGFAAFFSAFRAFGRPPPVDLAAVFRALDFFFTALVFLRAGLVLLGEETDRRAPVALRLAMFESFRNLDSLAISVVRSDAYRNSEKPRGAPDPSDPTPGNRSTYCRSMEEDA